MNHGNDIRVPIEGGHAAPDTLPLRQVSGRIVNSKDPDLLHPPETEPDAAVAAHAGSSATAETVRVEHTGTSEAATSDQQEPASDSQPQPEPHAQPAAAEAAEPTAAANTEAADPADQPTPAAGAGDDGTPPTNHPDESTTAFAEGGGDDGAGGPDAFGFDEKSFWDTFGSPVPDAYGRTHTTTHTTYDTDGNVESSITFTSSGPDNAEYFEDVTGTMRIQNPGDTPMVFGKVSGTLHIGPIDAGGEPASRPSVNNGLPWEGLSDQDYTDTYGVPPHSWSNDNIPPEVEARMEAYEDAYYDRFGNFPTAYPPDLQIPEDWA